MDNKKGKKRLSRSDMKKVKGGQIGLTRADGFGLMQKGLQELEDGLDTLDKPNNISHFGDTIENSSNPI